MNDMIPDIPVEPEKRSIWDRVSIVWLVPLLALAVALAVAWQSYNDRGPLIEIIFESAAGVAKDETELRFRDVTVGVVEDVSFTDTLDRVIVEVRLDKDIATYVDQEADFWIVRPQVTTQGVSGLDTVLSGVYLQGLWDDDVSELAYEFEGLDEAPLLTAGQAGLEVLLRSSDGSLSGNTPILYKGVAVGQIGTAMVSEDGFSVEAEAVVFAPYDNLVTQSTRFWDTSGFSLSVGAAGAAVDFESVASLIAGGVTFDTFVSGSSLAQDGDIFDVFSDSGTARASIFNRADGVSIELIATFDGNVAGLATGAVVELNGLPIGQVSGLNGVVDVTPSGESRVRLQTVLSIQPSRLGMEGSDNAQDALRFLATQVEGGLRARLVTGSILTGGLKVQLVTDADAIPAVLDLNARPFPSIPITDSEITDVATTAQGTLDRIDNLPIEELLEGATAFLQNAAVLIGSEDTQAVPGDLSAVLRDLRNVIGSDDVQALPAQLGAVMADLETTVASVQGILAQVEQQETVARVTDAVVSVTALTDELETTLAGVPALIEDITVLADRASSLELEVLVAEITGLAEGARGFIGADATQGLPAQIGASVETLQSTLAAAQTTLSELNDAEGVARVLEAVDSVAAVTTSIDGALVGVPELVAQIEAVAATAARLPLDDLVAQITALSVDAQSLIGTEAAQALPGDLSALAAELELTLASVTELVNGLNAEDAAVRLLAAVDAAAMAAGSVEGSFEGVPDLVARINAIAADAEGLELDALIDQLTGLVGSADTLLASSDTQALPGELNAALDQVAIILAEIREGGAVANTNAALLSARQAADAIAAATEGLPALLARANGLIAQADTTLSGFEDTSPAIRDARDALREVQEAADAVQSLARALERSPLLR